MSLHLIPCTIKDAKAFVSQVHRTHPAPPGGLFAVSCGTIDPPVIHAVAIVGRPVSRMLDDGWTVDVSRLASDGHKNACSLLYAACWRAARSLGYRRMGTYIAKDEDGTSLRAAGWRVLHSTTGGTWSRENRPRVDRSPIQVKIRWEATAS